MLALVRSFPTLADLERGREGWARKMPGEWDATSFDKWARNCPGITSGSSHAAKFVLSVWGGRALHFYPPVNGPWSAPATEWSCPWEIGGFDVMAALKIWDDAHRAAFLAWAKNPWWV